MQVSLSKFSPHEQAAVAQPSAQSAQANGPGQAGQQPAVLDPGSVRLDPLGRPMSIDHEHQVSILCMEHSTGRASSVHILFITRDASTFTAMLTMQWHAAHARLFPKGLTMLFMVVAQ